MKSHEKEIGIIFDPLQFCTSISQNNFQKCELSFFTIQQPFNPRAQAHMNTGHLAALEHEVNVSSQDHLKGQAWSRHKHLHLTFETERYNFSIIAKFEFFVLIYLDR